MKAFRAVWGYLLVGLALVAIPVAAQADPLLGVQDNLATQLIDYDNGGMVDYDGTTLTMNAFLVPPSSGLDVSLFDDGTATITVVMQVDGTGSLAGAGTVTILSDDSSGNSLLLSGDVTAFGWDASPALDRFDVTFDATGGSEQAFFTNAALYFNSDGLGVSFGGDWSQPFNVKPAKGAVGNLVPEPNAALLAGIALTAVALRSRKVRSLRCR